MTFQRRRPRSPLRVGRSAPRRESVGRVQARRRRSRRRPPPVPRALSTCARSLRGDHRSSSSRKLTQRPRAAAIPAFRATATPREVSCRDPQAWIVQLVESNRGSRPASRRRRRSPRARRRPARAPTGARRVREQMPAASRRDDDRDVGRRQAPAACGQSASGSSGARPCRRRRSTSLERQACSVHERRTRRGTRVAARRPAARAATRCSSPFRSEPVSTAHVTVRPPSSRDPDVVPAAEERPELVLRVAGLEVAVRSYSKPSTDDTSTLPPGRRTRAISQTASAGVGHVVERLDAHDEVERARRRRGGARSRRRPRRRTDCPRRRGRRSVRRAGSRSSYGREPHQTSSTSRRGEAAPRSLSARPADERAEVEVVELRDRRSTARAADRAEVVG